MLIASLLFFAGIIAGILSTVTGMASLVSYPILLATGLPPVVANVTNTAALIFSGLGSTVSSHRELRYNKRDLLWILPIALLGSVSGCVLLLAFPSKIFEKLAPFMIAAVAVFFIIQPRVRKQDAKHGAEGAVPVKRTALSMVAIFCIGMYGGYFGAASGVFMLLVFSMTQGLNILIANALKNVTMGAANLIATVIYIFFGQINWPFALMMGAGFVIGGFIGPVIARHLPSQILRWVIIIGAFILSIYMFKEAFL